jgi:hypothetical protein
VKLEKKLMLWNFTLNRKTPFKEELSPELASTRAAGKLTRPNIRLTLSTVL